MRKWIKGWTQKTWKGRDCFCFVFPFEVVTAQHADTAILPLFEKKKKKKQKIRQPEKEDRLAKKMRKKTVHHTHTQRDKPNLKVKWIIAWKKKQKKQKKGIISVSGVLRLSRNSAWLSLFSSSLTFYTPFQRKDEEKKKHKKKKSSSFTNKEKEKMEGWMICVSFWNVGSRPLFRTFQREDARG